MKNILVLAPHPDDEVLGAGGIIKKYSNTGIKVYVLVITRGNPKYYSEEKIINVRQEARNAHAILGVKETVFLEFNAPDLDMTPKSEISKSISKHIDKWKITDLYVPHHGDIHIDHKIVFEAALVSARPKGFYTVKRIYAYETLSETEWAHPFGHNAFVPTHFTDITDSFDFKIKALKCFKSQMRDFPDNRSTECVEALAKFRGATVGLKRAEAFIIIRNIED
jgi:LmbE family N-acetylglucosaminyl deacetylase